MEMYAHQISLLKQNPNKSVLVWSCGTSKTRTALEWSKLYVGSTLAIIPKPLLTNWKREMDKWNIHIDIMSKETFRRNHKKLKKYHQIIVDEIHNGFLTPNFKSQMSKALKWYLKTHEVKRFLGCSATVYTSSPWNIYNLGWYTGHEWNWQQFNNAFFDSVWMGNRQIPVVKKGIEQKLAELTRKIGNVVHIHDVLDVPLQNHLDPEYFSLTKEQQKAIKDNYDPVPIVRYTKQHEIEQGVLLADEFNAPQSFPCDKIDRLKQLVEENPKIAIIARYNAQIDYLADVLAVHDPFIIRGGVDDREALCRQADEAEKAIMLIQADSAEGYQLPSFPLCVFASMSYSYVKWEQLCGRFLRMDKPSRTTFIYLLIEEDSMDQAVFDSVKKKQDFSIEIYAKTRANI